MQVEDGSLVANADSYASVSFADVYAEARGEQAWLSADDEAKEAALIKATDYLEAAYRGRWKGYIVSPSQSLAWPRVSVPHPEDPGLLLPGTSVPKDVQRACVELALRVQAGTPLQPDQGRTVVREKVDVIEVEYDKNGPQAPSFPAVERLLQPYTRSTGGRTSTKLVRA